MNPNGLLPDSDGLFDTDRVDMGYHYSPHIMFDLSLDPHKDSYTIGDNLKLLLDIETAPIQQTVDIYFVMLNPDNKILFGMDWVADMNPWITRFALPADLRFHDVTLLNIMIPNKKLAIEQAGTYTFAFTAFQSNSSNFLSNMSVVGIKIE